MRADQPSTSDEATRYFGVAVSDIVWLALLSVMLFIVLLPFASYVAALSLIKEEWGLNNTQAGAIYSAYLAGYAVSALVIIPLTDRYGPKQIFLISTVISIVAHALFPLMAEGMVTGAIFRAAAGIGLVGVYMPGLRVISERFSNHGRGVAMGLFVSAFYTSNSVSLAVTGVLMAYFEWRDAFLILTVISTASLPLAYYLLRNHKHTPSGQSTGRLDLSVLKNRAARLYIFAYSLHALELYAARVWFPAFLMATLVARGVDDAQAAVTAATVGGIALAAGSVGPVMGGMLSDRWGRTTSASVIFALSGACSLAIGWLGGFPWPVIIGVGVFYGWAIAADSAIYSAAITEVSNPKNLGSTMALQSFLGFMGGVVGPIMVGGVLDLSPESIKWGIGFTFVGLVSIIAIIGLAQVRESKPAQLLPQRET